ncbi:MAG TPA: 30S ribosomal protein S1 [Deltaproteobacteria bacterium]|nr:30S ribosomal protein S1 [Deltaproteobacteria bacterium]
MMVDEEKSQGEGLETNFAKLFESSVQEIKVGDVVTGRVIQILDDTVMVDIGSKSEGRVRLDEFKGPDGKPTIKEGDEIKVLLLKWEDENGFAVLSKTKADQLKVWDEIVERFDKGENIEGVISQKIKGGFYVDIDGVTAFLPNSQVDLKPVRNPDDYIGKRFEFRILKYSRRKNNVIVSRRKILEEERERLRAETLSKLEEGMIMKGVVKNITDYGAFVDLGGIDGLIHLTDMSWGKITHPSNILSVGDEVNVKVLKFNREDEKISLGLKQTMPDPWLTVDEKYSVGDRVEGRVVNITDYGAFVELEEGLEGLVHISEMSWTKIRHPSQKLKPGDRVEVMILNIDAANRRISLGLKQVEPNPWDEIVRKYPKGSIVRGVVKNITDFGVFVGVEEGIDGLIHISDLSWKKVKHPSELFTKGQEVEAMVLNIDRDAERFSLSTKAVEANPWEGVEERYRPGMIVEGVVTGLADFGAFVEIEDGLEGLVHVSELNRGRQQCGDIKVGDHVAVEVLNVAPLDRKIALSIRDVLVEPEQEQAEAETEAAGEEDAES